MNYQIKKKKKFTFIDLLFQYNIIWLHSVLDRYHVCYKVQEEIREPAVKNEPVGINVQDDMEWMHAREHSLFI